MTIYKSTKIGLAVAGFALAAQISGSLLADAQPSASETMPTPQAQQISQKTASNTFNECMNTRRGRNYEERSASNRSTTERKTRSEIYAEREAECKDTAPNIATTQTTNPSYASPNTASF